MRHALEILDEGIIKTRNTIRITEQVSTFLKTNNPAYVYHFG